MRKTKQGEKKERKNKKRGEEKHKHNYLVQAPLSHVKKKEM